MAGIEIIKELVVKNESKIVLLVMDGVGGLPGKDGKTELESARIPNLNRLAKGGVCGLTDAIAPGITPGSGPSHFSLFGYDPFKYQIGRGVLEALGIGMELTGRDLAARANFATQDKKGIITDRRAGRIPTEKNVALCARLQEEIKEIDGVEVIIKPGREHRLVVVFRGDGLDEALTESDPQKEGLPAAEIKHINKGAEKSAKAANKFLEKANKLLEKESPANTVLLRGWAKVPNIPSVNDAFGLQAAAIASYPMYRGLAKLVGMSILVTGESISDEIETLEKSFAKYDFFFIHVKKTDSYGEDGNFDAKVHVIEEVDSLIPGIEALKPGVFVVTGDHSTPSILKGHSWHPNPFLLVSTTCRPDNAVSFSERECTKGGLGRFPSQEAMALMLAHAGRLKKFGA